MGRFKVVPKMTHSKVVPKMTHFKVVPKMTHLRPTVWGFYTKTHKGQA